MANIDLFIAINRVPEELKPLVAELKPFHWGLMLCKLQANSVTSTRHRVVKTGYYDYSTRKPKRMTYKNVIKNACARAGFMFEEVNFNKRKGAEGEAVIIYY